MFLFFLPRDKPRVTLPWFWLLYLGQQTFLLLSSWFEAILLFIKVFLELFTFICFLDTSIYIASNSSIDFLNLSQHIKWRISSHLCLFASVVSTLSRYRWDMRLAVFRPADSLHSPSLFRLHMVVFLKAHTFIIMPFWWLGFAMLCKGVQFLFHWTLFVIFGPRCVMSDWIEHFVR